MFLVETHLSFSSKKVRLRAIHLPKYDQRYSISADSTPLTDVKKIVEKPSWQNPGKDKSTTLLD